MSFVNSPRKFLGRTIYVSNHAASFMDPISIAALRRPIVFFMTRSDVFKPITNPFLWACHMLPIFRQHDGEDTKGKNEAVFKRCANVLKWGRNLLIFGEGFTDDQFIRRLKPVKKGALKIGFSSLELLNWNEKIYICALGVNYSDPNKMRSDYLISYGNPICLNDYREEYNKNPNKVITDLTRKIEKEMQQQITHVEEKELTAVHEQIMILTRRGMHFESYSKSRSLQERWNYSRELALWINREETASEKHPIWGLKDSLSTYFSLLKRLKLTEELVYWKLQDPSCSRNSELLRMVVLAPFAVLGLVHTLIPYLITKRFAERSFKRKVFWGSVKLIMGMILMGLVNIPVIFLFYHFIYPSWLLAFAYYASIGLTGLAAYMWFVNYKRFKAKGIVKNTDLTKIFERREAAIRAIQTVLPASFH